MRKRISLFCNEKINKETVIVEHGIYNGFGKMVSLPSTIEIKSTPINFDSDELGDLFIQMGNQLKREKSNITNISINYSFAENPTYMGKQFMAILGYDTEESL